MKIRKKPEELWQFFADNVFRLKYEDYVAAEDDNGVTITLSSSVEYEPILTVEQDGALIGCYVVSDERTLEETAEKMYSLFLSDGEERTAEPAEEVTAEDEGEAAAGEETAAEDDIDALYEREDALMMAFKDFVSVAIEEDETIYDVSLESDLAAIMDEVLQLISDAGFLVRRPMYITNEDGTETLTEYPYEPEEDSQVE